MLYLNLWSLTLLEARRKTFHHLIVEKGYEVDHEELLGPGFQRDRRTRVEVLAAPELKGVKMTRKSPLNRVLPPCFGCFSVLHLKLWSLTPLQETGGRNEAQRQ